MSWLIIFYGMGGLAISILLYRDGQLENIRRIADNKIPPDRFDSVRSEWLRRCATTFSFTVGIVIWPIILILYLIDLIRRL